MNPDNSTNQSPYPEIAVAGSGAIATGLAALASCHSERVWILVRSKNSADRAMELVKRASSRMEDADPGRVVTTMTATDFAHCGLVVEAIVEELEAKSRLLRDLAGFAPESDLASTTSSLSIGQIASAAGVDERLFGLHVFNPVPAMDLVELCLPESLPGGIGERARTWCATLGKTVVVVPDTPGFVVNRLLFPYLFDAVRFHERTGMSPDEVDTCMTLGVAHPMGPLALLDLIGLDVAVEIGRALNADSGNPDHLAPLEVVTLVAGGHLGRKSGRGFYEYS